MTREITHKKGILRPEAAKRHFKIERYLPSESLLDIVEHYWIVRWDMGESVYESQVVTYPGVNIVFSQQEAIISGIDTNKFSHTITGKGVIAGILFKPAGFAVFYDKSLDTLTDRSISLQHLFDIDRQKSLQVVAMSDDATLVHEMESMLLKSHPVATERIRTINAVAEAIMNDAAITKVSDITRYFSITERTLQHLFKRYVGVSPKWVIMRYRIQEAAHLLSSDTPSDWTDIAIDLGYSDQAHFIRDFKKTIGQTPSEYLRSK